MDQENIINTITNIFSGADEHNWNKVQASMADDVLLDYSSMTGSPANTISSFQIIAAWRGFLPGFDRTHHQVSDFKIDQRDDSAYVIVFGKADHFIDDEKWTVEGTYDLELIRTTNNWKVTKFKFNLLKQSGNTDLPQKATEIAAMKNK